MWRQDDLFNVLGAGGNPLLGVPPAADVAEVVARIDPAEPGTGACSSACPLMHGTGQFSALIAMAVGGAVVTLPSRHFDVAELWGDGRAAAGQRTSSSSARPSPARCSTQLDANPGRYDLSSVVVDRRRRA